MSANATEVAAYRDLYYKEVDERDNPIMWLDLSNTMGTIEYKRGYPYIEWQQRVLEGDDVMIFNPQYMTLLEAQKKAIVEDEYLGFSIKPIDFKNLLSNSQINYQDKKRAILSLTEKDNALTEKLIELLIHNKRITIIGDIAISFIQLYNEQNNIKEATVITASPINKELESEILSKINTSNVKSVNLTNIVDPNIIGGFIIRFDGKEYNASVKQNLNNLKKELTN